MGMARSRERIAQRGRFQRIILHHAEAHVVIEFVHAADVILFVPRRAALENRHVKRRARASSLAISRPVQPPPIITTSILGRVFTFALFLCFRLIRRLFWSGLRRYLLPQWFVFAGPVRFRSHLRQAHRLGTERLTAVLLDFGMVAHARAGEADQLPADHVHIAAMLRIAEHSLDRVAAQHVKKQSFFDLLQPFVLLRRAQAASNPASCFRPCAIDFAAAWLCALVAKFRRRGRRRKARACSGDASRPQGPASCRSMKISDARFTRAGAGLVAGKNPRRSRRDNQRFVFGEKAQRNADFLAGCRSILGRHNRHVAVERVNQHSADAGCRKDQKFAAFHAAESTTNQRYRTARIKTTDAGIAARAR